MEVAQTAASPNKVSPNTVLPDHVAAPPLDADEGQTGGARLLLDDLVADADRRPADLLRGHDVTGAHRSFPASRGLRCGLTGPTRRDTGRIPRPISAHART